ncbi:MAG TPA: ABC transporter permease [Ignavibacteria bacterium]|nr:ABC transporter permease [Ignavibacteria bacterium]
MPLSIFIAKKYISNKQSSKFLSLVSVISVIGIAIGTAVLIIALTILNGFEEIVAQKIVNFNSHIKITAFGNRNLPDSDVIKSEITQKIGEDFHSISEFISKLGIIKSRTLSEGVTIVGIDTETDNTNIDEYIVEGNYELDSEEIKQIIIGKKLSEKINTSVNDKITIFSLKKDELPDADNPPAIEQYIISGIFESGMAEYDDMNVYISLSHAKELFETYNSISGYNIRLNNVDSIDSSAKALQDLLGYPYYVRTIFQVHQNIFTWLDLQKEPIPIILGLIIVVAIFNIVGTMLMIVLERTSSIGVLKAIGFTKKKILQIFFVQGVFLGLLGITIGCILALVLSYLQLQFNLITLPASIYFISTVPISIDIENYLIVAGIGLVLSLLASLIPSYVASRMNIISSIRFN